MAIEKSTLSYEDIKQIMNEDYGIYGIKKIESIDQGSSNIFKVETDSGKYILKEYNSDRKIESVEKEIDVIEYLRLKKINVPSFIKNVKGGYTKNKNGKIITGDYNRVIQSAEILGKIVKALKGYNGLDENDVMEKMFSRQALEKAIKNLEREYENTREDSKYRDIIKRDLKDKISMGKYIIENFDFEILRKISILGTHGDYSIRQLIYEGDNKVTVIDFETARKMPITWEIMRSYSYVDEKAKNAEFDINNLFDYYREFSKHVELKREDLQYAPHIYLLQLVGSPFGYREYNRDSSQEELLNFGQYRTGLCKYLFNHLEYIGEKLVKIKEEKRKDTER